MIPKERYAMKSSYRRNPGMEQINQVIPKSIHALGKKVERAYQEHFVLARWPEIVGETVAAHVWPLAVDGEKLVLYTALPTWRNEIMLMQMMILTRFNNFAGYEMVKELAFSWEKHEVYRRPAQNDAEDTEEKEQEAYQESLRTVVLTSQEKAECESGIESVADERLREKLRAIAEMRKKREKARCSLGEKPCSVCGKLVAGEGLCLSCRWEEKRERRRLIRGLLRDLPWVRYQEIQTHVPCTPAMVASERSRLVQEMARHIEFGDWSSLEAKTLVMLYRSVRPEQLTEEILRRTLYDLRKELAGGAVFRPFPKRAQIMARTAEKKGGEGSHVFASR